MTGTHPRYSKEEFARRGDDIYERDVRPRVGPDDEGKFVVLDIETGAYEIDEDEIAASDRLLARYPDSQVWLTRVGSRYAFRFGPSAGSGSQPRGAGYTRLMSQSAVPHKLPSVEEYLELEEAATVRHEYVAGQIYAFAGATKRHNRIVGNIFGRLWDAARGGPCRVYSNDVKLRAADDVFYYPDVMVACGPEGESPIYEETPCLIFEVISSSTKAIDRREKLLAYKRLSSVEAYLIVHQEEAHVERHWRDEQGTWWQADVVGEGVVPVPCPEKLELTLADIYEGLS